MASTRNFKFAIYLMILVRQGSVCSDSDVPFVSYTVNKPIGDSPKKSTPSSSRSKFSSPRLLRAQTRNMHVHCIPVKDCSKDDF